MGKHVLITGGTGFLGCHLARRLLKLGYEVTLFDLAPLTAKDLQGKVTVVKGDVRSKRSVQKAMEGQQFVIHAAAALPIQHSRKLIMAVNVTGCKNVLDTALSEKVKRVVFISTTAMYGVPKHLPETEESPIDPIGNYGQSKAMAEDLCHLYEAKGLSVNIIRPKTFLGPERLGVFQLWFEAIYTGHRVFILGNGKNKYQLLAVSDVVDAIIKAMETDVTGETFNIGAREFKTWKKDLGFIVKHEKSTSKITGFPVLPSQIILSLLEKLHLSPIAAWHYKTLPVNSYVSTEKAEKMLGWKAKKSNQDLLLESYLWYKKHRNKIIDQTGTTHRVGWNFKILSLVSRF